MNALKLNGIRVDVISDMILRLSQAAICEAANAKKTRDWSKFEGMNKSIEVLKELRRQAEEL